MEEKRNYKDKINLLDKEWEKKYVKPKLGFPKGHIPAYKSFYVRFGSEIKRYGVYDVEHMTGTYYGSVKMYCKSKGEYELNNIIFDPFMFYIDKKDNKLNVLKYNYVYDNEELDNVYTFYITAPKRNSIVCCINNKVIKIIDIDGVGTYKFCPACPNCILYYKNKNERICKIYCYDILENREYILGERDRDIYHSIWPINDVMTYNLLRSLGDTTDFFHDENNVYFYFSYSSSKAFMILFDYVQNADKIEIVSNFLKNDPTINYKITYSLSRKKEIEFILSIILYNEIRGISIFGYKLREIVKRLTYGNELDSKIFELCDTEYKEICEIITALKNELGIKYDNVLLEKIALKYGKEFLHWQWNNLNYVYPYEPYLNKNEYEDIYSKLVDEDKIKIKWKNENDMYKLIKKYYPDAIYQYHSEWLKLQSLDVFIPSLKIAFEYQGEQHYHGVEVFGGEAKYSEQHERDIKKKELCEANGVKLIEWMYNEKISFKNLKDKLLKFNINIELNDCNNSKSEKEPEIANYQIVEKIGKDEQSQLINFAKTNFNISKMVDGVIWIDEKNKVWTLNHASTLGTLNDIHIYHFNNECEYYLIINPSENQLPLIKKNDIFWSYISDEIKKNINNKSFIELIIKVKQHYQYDYRVIPINDRDIDINSEEYNSLRELSYKALGLLKEINPKGCVSKINLSNIDIKSSCNACEYRRIEKRIINIIREINYDLQNDYKLSPVARKYAEEIISIDKEFDLAYVRYVITDYDLKRLNEKYAKILAIKKKYIESL